VDSTSEKSFCGGLLGLCIRSCNLFMESCRVLQCSVVFRHTVSSGVKSEVNTCFRKLLLKVCSYSPPLTYFSTYQSNL